MLSFAGSSDLMNGTRIWVSWTRGEKCGPGKGLQRIAGPGWTRSELLGHGTAAHCRGMSMVVLHFFFLQYTE